MTLTPKRPPTLQVHGELATIHRATGPLLAALETIPDWVAARDLLLVLQATPGPASRMLDVDSAREDVKAQVLAAAAEGKPLLPVDLAALLLAQESERAAVIAAHELVKEVTRQVVDDLSTAVRTNTDAILTHLNGQLQTLLAATEQTITQLAGATSAAEAIASACVDAWSEHMGQQGLYAELRSAQVRVIEKLWSSVAPSTSTLHKEARLFASVTEVFPHFLAWKRYGFLMDAYGNKKHLTPPWPDPSSAEFLRWLVTSPAQAWIPTQHQYEQAHEVIRASRDGAPREDRMKDPSSYPPKKRPVPTGF